MNTEQIARNLVALRGERSRERVAADIGVSVSAISMYENGERIPRDEVKIRIANYYNTSVEAIFYAGSVTFSGDGKEA